MESDRLTVKATIENLDLVMQFVDSYLDRHDCPAAEHVELNIAVDEIFSNICFYAYTKQPDKEGEVTVSLERLDDSFAFRASFEDQGIPYNPLEKEDPDVTLPAEERQIGGLGIFIVKKTMDAMEYERIENKNVLTITKKIKGK